jgi:hypothetical protein
MIDVKQVIDTSCEQVAGIVGAALPGATLHAWPFAVPFAVVAPLDSVHAAFSGAGWMI